MQTIQAAIDAYKIAAAKLTDALNDWDTGTGDLHGIYRAATEATDATFELASATSVGSRPKLKEIRQGVYLIKHDNQGGIIT